MSRLIESIQVNNGALMNVPFHQERIARSSLFLWNSVKEIDFLSLQELANNCDEGIYKCRIIYDLDSTQISFIKYNRKPIRTLKIIHADHIDYSCKYEDRSAINDLFSLKGEADDILIVKNGMIMDTSYCNVALYNGKDWITPKTPLLKGTKRAELLIKNQIIAEDISIDNLMNYHKITLFNAMINPFEISIKTQQILT